MLPRTNDVNPIKDAAARQRHGQQLHGKRERDIARFPTHDEGVPPAIAARAFGREEVVQKEPVRGSPTKLQEVRDVLQKQGNAPRDIEQFLKCFSDPSKGRTLAATRSATLSVANAAAKCPERRLPSSPVLTEAARFRWCEVFVRNAVAQEVESEAIVAALLNAYFGLTHTTAAEAAKAKVLAQEIVFGALLRHAVAADSRSASFDFVQCRAGAWPGSCTLSRWYRVATMAGTYSDRVLTSADVARAERVAAAVNDAHKDGSRLAVWLIEGVGRILHHLLHTLITLYKWADARIDSVLELTLVDRNKSANDFHEWAIPCAEVLRGSMRKVIQGSFGQFPAAFPSVAEFVYAAPLHGIIYEPGSCPGSGFDLKQFAVEAAQACGTVLKANDSARLFVSYQLTENDTDGPPSCFRKALRPPSLAAVDYRAAGDMAVFRVTKAAK